MRVNEVIEIYTSAIRDAADQGAESVPVSELERVNAAITAIAGESPDDVAVGEAALVRYKAQLSADSEYRRNLHEFDLEMLRSTIMTGQAALKGSLLINGGAAVAVLAFVGNAWTKDVPRHVLAGASYGLSLFVWGVLAAATALGATYLSQAGFGNEFGKYSNRIGAYGRGLAIALVITSYGLFACAAWQTYSSLSS